MSRSRQATPATVTVTGPPCRRPRGVVEASAGRAALPVERGAAWSRRSSPWRRRGVVSGPLALGLAGTTSVSSETCAVGGGGSHRGNLNGAGGGGGGLPRRGDLAGPAAERRVLALGREHLREGSGRLEARVLHGWSVPPAAATARSASPLA